MDTINPGAIKLLEMIPLTLDAEAFIRENGCIGKKNHYRKAAA